MPRDGVEDERHALVTHVNRADIDGRGEVVGQLRSDREGGDSECRNRDHYRGYPAVASQHAENRNGDTDAH